MRGRTVQFVDQKVTKKLSPKPCSDPFYLIYKPNFDDENYKHVLEGTFDKEQISGSMFIMYGGEKGSSLKKSESKRVVKSTKYKRSFTFLVTQAPLDTSSLEVQCSKNNICRIFWDKYQGKTMIDPIFYNQPITIQSRR